MGGEDSSSAWLDHRCPGKVKQLWELRPGLSSLDGKELCAPG